MSSEGPLTPVVSTEIKEEKMAFCSSCGAQMNEGDTFCVKCGFRNIRCTLQPGFYTPVVSAPAQNNGQAIAALILGIIGIFAWLLPFIGFPVTIAGLVLGIQGLKSQKSGMAIAGLVLSCIFLLATIINAVAGVLLAV